jgi:hypothetical protein
MNSNDTYKMAKITEAGEVDENDMLSQDLYACINRFELKEPRELLGGCHCSSTQFQSINTTSCLVCLTSVWHLELPP